MRAFAPKQNPNHQATSAGSKARRPGYLAQSQAVSSLLHLQDAIGNQAVQRLLQTHTQDIEAGSAATAPASLQAADRIVVAQPSPDGVPVTQRQTDRFGPTSTAPADWKTKVKAAKSSAERAALIQTVLGLKVSDVTAASAKDASPTGAHLEEYSGSKQTINYDDGLNSKNSPVDKRALSENAGYTLHSSGKIYVVLGPKALDAERYYYPRTILNHEFDHVRQDLSGSKLKGNESELDAWTSSFIRDFHRTYLLGDKGGTCFVQSVTTFVPMLDYYRKKDVREAQRDACVKRITDYYNTTVSGHEGHKHAFRFWIHRTLKKITVTPNLAERLNTDLKLGIDATDSLSTTRQFSCGKLKSLSYSAPTVDKPNFSSPTSKPGKSAKKK